MEDEAEQQQMQRRKLKQMRQQKIEEKEQLRQQKLEEKEQLRQQKIEEKEQLRQQKIEEKEQLRQQKTKEKEQLRQQKQPQQKEREQITGANTSKRQRQPVGTEHCWKCGLDVLVANYNYSTEGCNDTVACIARSQGNTQKRQRKAKSHYGS